MYGHADVRMQRHHQAVRAHPRQLFHHDRVVDEIHAAAAVFGRRVGAEEAGLAHLAPTGAIAHPDAIPLRHLRLDLGIDKPPHLRAKHLVLFSKNLSSHHCETSIKNAAMKITEIIACAAGGRGDPCTQYEAQSCAQRATLLSGADGGSIETRDC